MPHDVDSNQVVSVKEMAAMLQMSRSRLYQLIHKFVLLPPIYDTETRRPFYPADLIQQNINAKRKNRGVNGKPMLFYAARQGKRIPTTKAPASKNKGKRSDLIEELRALHLDATDADVDAALGALYPDDQGASVGEGERLRAVYRWIRCRNDVQNPADNVGA